jgi:uncharacterized protein involved in type VI secretion and phage assembly
MRTDPELLAELADRLRNRFYGKYRGTVSDVDESTLRIKAKVPAVLGTTESGWALPCVPYAGPEVGFFAVPEVGAGVWIEFEGGDVSYPIWTGCYWRASELPSDASPTVKGIVTKAGHKLLFDDDGQQISLTDPNGNQVSLDSSGITQSRGGQSVIISDSSVNVDDGAWQVS